MSIFEWRLGNSIIVYLTILYYCTHIHWSSTSKLDIARNVQSTTVYAGAKHTVYMNPREKEPVIDTSLKLRILSSISSFRTFFLLKPSSKFPPSFHYY